MGRTPPGETRGRVYRLVRERLWGGRSPTVREVQQALGFRAVQTAREHLVALVAEGRLLKEPGHRGYRLPTHPEAATPIRIIPLLGRVQAGALDTAVEDLEGYLPVQASEGEELFGLIVRGESMVGAGILPGDVVVVRRQPTARSGEIVVALVDDEATIKRLLVRRAERVELVPENPDFATLIPEPGTVTILGKVIEVRRHLEPRNYG